MKEAALDLAVSASELKESALDRKVLPPKERDGEGGIWRERGISVVPSSEAGCVVGFSWCKGCDMSVESLKELPDRLTVRCVEMGGASNLLEVILYFVEG